MPIQLMSKTGLVPEVDGTTYRTMRTTAKPVDQRELGHEGFMTKCLCVPLQNSLSFLFVFKWLNPDFMCVLTKLRMNWLQTAAATATIFPVYQAFLSDGSVFWTGIPGAADPVFRDANQLKKRTTHGRSILGTNSVWKTATGIATGVTTGGATFLTDPFLELPVTSFITTPNPRLYEVRIEDPTGDGQHPVAVFQQNQGFGIRQSGAFGAAGAATLRVNVSWVEVPIY